MSDSDEDLIPSITNTFNYGNTTTQIFRQNVNSTCMPDFNYRNNLSNSIYNMQSNMRSNYSEYGFNSRSIYNRREVSPMSLRSVPDFNHRNMQHPYYRSGMGSLRSSASVRSMDSTASVSAADIAQAFKLANFNKYDVRVIKDAYNKYMKSRVRERIEKRRNLRLFLKRSRRRSGEDSGEHGSDSSSSSDGYRSMKSTRSAIPRENILSHITKAKRSEIMKLKTTMRDSDMYKDRTENFKQNAFKNFVVANNNNRDSIVETTHSVAKDRFHKGFLLPSQKFNKGLKTTASSQILDRNCTNRYPKNTGVEHSKDKSMSGSENEEIFSRDSIGETNISNCVLDKNATIKETFSEKGNNDFNFKKPTLPFRKQIKLQNSFMPLKPLPSRGLKSQMEPRDMFAGKQSNISNKNEDNIMNKDQTHRKEINDSDSEKEEIFANVTGKENSVRNNNLVTKQKRALTAEDVSSPKGKRSKTASTPSKKLKKPQGKENLIGKGEILLAKSSQQLNGNLELNIPINNKNNELSSLEDTVEKTDKTTCASETLSNNDSSMRPSFIKRKLFTQKLDVLDNKNISSDSSQSPSTKSYNFKEKNKVRKLASQSCLTRDVLTEDNVLDLIHKIVPPEQMNLTNASARQKRPSNTESEGLTNARARQKRKSNTESDDKWDVTSVMSTCHNNDISDTFTDEEIFGTNQHHVKKCQPNTENLKVHKEATVESQCKVVVKIQPVNVDKIKNKAINAEKIKSTSTISVASCIRTFWDTDYESDDEKVRSLSRSIRVKPNDLIKVDENIPKVKDSLSTTNKLKINLIGTTGKDSYPILNAKPTNSCQITRQVNNKLIQKNAKFDEKQAANKGKKNPQDKANNGRLKNKQQEKEETDISQNISNLSDDLGVVTRSFRRKNKENNTSQSSAGERSILTRSRTLKSKENLNESQSSACDQSLTQSRSHGADHSLSTRNRSTVKKRKMNETQSSLERSMLTRSQSINGKNILNESNILTHSQRFQNGNKRTTQPVKNATSSDTALKTVKSSCTRNTRLKNSPINKSKTKTICAR